jgi:SpoVK/Ycf46/Vps4 family AAA+-type ATPase
VLLLLAAVRRWWEVNAVDAKLRQLRRFDAHFHTRHAGARDGALDDALALPHNLRFATTVVRGRAGVGKSWLLQRALLGGGCDGPELPPERACAGVLSSPALRQPAALRLAAAELHGAAAAGVVDSWAARVHHAAMRGGHDAPEAGSGADPASTGVDEVLSRLRPRLAPVVVCIEDLDAILPRASEDDEDDGVTVVSHGDTDSAGLLDAFVRRLAQYAAEHTPVMLVLEASPDAALPKSWATLAVASAELCLTTPAAAEREWLTARLLLEQYERLFALAHDHGHARDLDGATSVSAAFLRYSGVAANMTVGTAEAALLAFTANLCAEFPALQRAGDTDVADALPSLADFARVAERFAADHRDAYTVLPACARAWLLSPVDASAQLALFGDFVAAGEADGPLAARLLAASVARVLDMLGYRGLLTAAVALSPRFSGLTLRTLVGVFAGALTRYESLAVDALVRAADDLKREDAMALCPYMMVNPLGAQAIPQSVLDAPDADMLDYPLSPTAVLAASGAGAACGGAAVQSAWSAVRGLESTVRRLQQLAAQWARADVESASARGTRKLGSAIPSGVLLCGPSGSGKTLLSHALAASSGLNALQMGCADVFQKYLGESERKIRELFQYARELAPCIVVLDELDVMAPNRSSVTAQSSSGVELRVLSTLLNELDGIAGRQGVFVLGICRVKAHIDAALIRPGRFDEVLELLPAEGANTVPARNARR